MTLIDPYIVGGATPLYALTSSVVNIQGGTLFTAFSGGHGPYASLQGQITINFHNENSATRWDLTGKETSTTELYGNLYCAAPSGSGMWVTTAGSMVVNLENSQWQGAIENQDDGVTLTLADGAVIAAADGCSLRFEVDGQTYDTLLAGTYTDVLAVVPANGETVYDGIYTAAPAAEDDPSEEPVDTQQSDEAGAASGEASDEAGSASGEVGGSSGEVSMVSGEFAFSTGNGSNCTHETAVSVVDISWEVADPAVAALHLDGQDVLIEGLVPGETVATVTLTCSDGSEMVETVSITVE